MGKKKASDKPYCWYCERTFEDEKILIQHQKAKHFKCPHCNRKLASASGMVVHVQTVHKEVLSKVPNSKPGRDSVEYEIYGMEGIPDEDEIDDRDIKRIKQDGAPSSFTGAVPPNPYAIPHGARPSLIPGYPPGVPTPWNNNPYNYQPPPPPTSAMGGAPVGFNFPNHPPPPGGHFLKYPPSPYGGGPYKQPPLPYGANPNYRPPPNTPPYPHSIPPNVNIPPPLPQSATSVPPPPPSSSSPTTQQPQIHTGGSPPPPPPPPSDSSPNGADNITLPPPPPSNIIIPPPSIPSSTTQASAPSASVVKAAAVVVQQNPIGPTETHLVYDDESVSMEEKRALLPRYSSKLTSQVAH